MTIETFVRTSGAVMGIARESFGPGGGLPPLAPAAGAVPAAPSSSGRTADAAASDSSDVQNAVTTLSEHDQTGNRQLSDALTAAGTGRGRMDRIIAAALADVGDADISTPQGQRALVEAITRHLEDSKETVDATGADAATRAAAAHTAAAGYSGVAPQMQPATMMPAMPAGAAGPPSGMGSMPGLGGLASLMHGPARESASGTAETAQSEAEPTAAPLIGSDARSVARYIYQQARAHGYSPRDALAITAYAKGESGFSPTVSGGPQGGAGSENVVVGNFQEKPQFARDAGLDPAQRYTVEGNTEIYLRTLAHHRNDPGDIFDHLLATSSGGPMATGGRGKMAELMAQTRELLAGTTST